MQNGEAVINTNKVNAVTSGGGSGSNSKDATPKKKTSVMNGSATHNHLGPYNPMLDIQTGGQNPMGKTGKAPAPPPKDGVASANERVQNYINNLESNHANMDGTSSLGYVLLLCRKASEMQFYNVVLR